MKIEWDKKIEAKRRGEGSSANPYEFDFLMKYVPWDEFSKYLTPNSIYYMEVAVPYIDGSCEERGLHGWMSGFIYIPTWEELLEYNEGVDDYVTIADSGETMLNTNFSQNVSNKSIWFLPEINTQDESVGVCPPQINFYPVTLE